MNSLNSNFGYDLIINLIIETVCFYSLNNLYSLKYQNIILIRIIKENDITLFVSICLQKNVVALDFKIHNDERFYSKFTVYTKLLSRVGRKSVEKLMYIQWNNTQQYNENSWPSNMAGVIWLIAHPV